MGETVKAAAAPTLEARTEAQKPEKAIKTATAAAPFQKESRKFWNFIDNGDETELRINGYIAEESWFNDEVTPAMFRRELSGCNGDITVWINSFGGDVFAASQIYTMLKEYPHNVKVKIDGVAASAASVIAMAGDSVEMAPTACLMIHNPAAAVFGEVGDLEQGIELLIEVKEAIINAYAQKTKLPRDTISKLMDAETWMNANKAVELGFADKVLYSDGGEDGSSYLFNRGSYITATVNAMRQKLKKKQEALPPVSQDAHCKEKMRQDKDVVDPAATPLSVLEKRLSLIK